MTKLRRIQLLIAVLVVFTVVLMSAPERILAPTEDVSPITSPSDTVGTVNRIIDGDTLEVDGRVVRLLGVDAPEQERCFYHEARQQLARMTLGRVVLLERDHLNEDTDDYGRLLRYVYLPDRTLVNATLIEDGFARHLSWFPIEKNKAFAELENHARHKKRGLWRQCD